MSFEKTMTGIVEAEKRATRTSALAIDTLRKTLRRLEEIQASAIEGLAYHEKEIIDARARIADGAEQIKGLADTIALLEKV